MNYPSPQPSPPRLSPLGALAVGILAIIGAISLIMWVLSTLWWLIKLIIAAVVVLTVVSWWVGRKNPG